MADDATKFGLMRHAQTVWNREGRIQGQMDSDLTASGEAAARSWGEILKGRPWGRILVSDLGRARRTADLVNASLGLPVTVEPRLRELNWGGWAGKTVREIRDRFPGLLEAQEVRGWGFCPPGGESRLDQFERCRDALADAARQWPGETLLTVTHGGVLRTLIYRFLDRAFLSSESAVIKPYHLHWFSVENGRLDPDQINALTLGHGASEHFDKSVL